jgi:hypothetical protein
MTEPTQHPDQERVEREAPRLLEVLLALVFAVQLCQEDHNIKAEMVEVKDVPVEVEEGVDILEEVEVEAVVAVKQVVVVEDPRSRITFNSFLERQCWDLIPPMEF